MSEPFKRGKKWRRFGLSLCLLMFSGCVTAPPGAGGFPIRAEPPPVQIEVTALQTDAGQVLVVSAADRVRLNAYINALRLSFQENLVSLKRCAGE